MSTALSVLRKGYFPLFIFVCASLCGLAFLIPSFAHAAQLDVIDHVENAGVHITEGGVYQRAQFGSPTKIWRVYFDWPHNVSNRLGFVAIIKGEFGNMSEPPSETENYGPNFQQWFSGTNGLVKSLNLAPLGNLDAEEGMYTLLLAELNSDFDQAGTMEWFASGGVSGNEPANHAFLTFEYQKYQECCSSVVFLPGFEGSILKTDSGTNTLWPPTLGDVESDLSKLAILTNDLPVDPTIVVDGVLENFQIGPFGVPIYRDFVTSMNALLLNQPDTNKPLIKEWHALAYDWRFAPETILTEGIKTPGGLLDVLGFIEQVAEESDTGQVTLVAHSMGGLLGTVIIKEFEDQEKEELVDSFVMVGVPQLGTPQAVTGLLHGEGAAIPVILDKEAARTLAYNMQSVHNLLPSQEYFNRVTDPVVTFDSETVLTQQWRNVWGLALGNFIEYFDFIVGNDAGRTRPALIDTHNPEVLRIDLVQDALDLHNELDNYAFPLNINVIQIAGWGSQTITGVTYTEDGGILDYQARYTIEGDGTVVYPSAVSHEDQDSYFVHLANFNDSERKNTQHRDFIGTRPVFDLIEMIVREEIVGGIDFISKTKPTVTNAEDLLLVSAHSPVTIGVHDNFGNFTGIAPGQDINADIVFIQEDIPGSTYRNIGEGKYILVPKVGNYTFVMQGTGTGDTTIRTETFENNVMRTVATYSNIPTTPQTSASFVVNSSSPEATIVELDTDSDGEVDENITPDTDELTIDEIIVLLKETIFNLDAKQKVKNNLLKRVERIEKKIIKKIEKNKKIIANLEKKINKKKNRGKIDEERADELLSLLSELETSSTEIILDSNVVQELKEKLEQVTLDFSLRWQIQRRVDNLEQTTAIMRVLSKTNANVIKKGEKGKVVEGDVEEVLGLLKQLESRL